MAEKNTLVVKICGQEYTIASDESREYMLGIADLVDRKMNEVMQFRPDLNTKMTAVLAALNMAEDYVRLERDAEVWKQKAEKYDEMTRRQNGGNTYGGYNGRR